MLKPTSQKELLRLAQLGEEEIDLSDLQLKIVQKPYLLDLTDEEGMTPLHWAVVNGKKATVEGLLGYGADPNATTRAGESVLHLAASSKATNYCEILELLVNFDYGLGDLLLVHIKTPNDDNPFHYLFGRPLDRLPPLAVVKKLLNMELHQNKTMSSSLLTSPNQKGVTPLQMLKNQNLSDFINMTSFYIHHDPKPHDTFELQVASDIHIEFKAEDYSLAIVPRAPYLALLGDIGLPKYLADYSGYLNEQSEKFEKVFVLLGNHEFYGCSVTEAKLQLKMIESQCERKNIHFMDKTSLLVDGVRILGCTLWSDISPQNVDFIEYALSDYKHIKKSDTDHRRLEVADSLGFHQEELNFLIQEINLAKANKEPVVILTHHAPHTRFGVCNPEDLQIRQAFCTNLIHLFGEPVSAWCFGHTHWFQNTKYQGTQLISNPKGYSRDKMPYNPSFVVSVPLM